MPSWLYENSLFFSHYFFSNFFENNFGTNGMFSELCAVTHKAPKTSRGSSRFLSCCYGIER